MLLKLVAKAYARNFINRVSDLKSSTDLERNGAWRNSFRGRRCFILGSGMSINNHDLSLLENEIVMTQNNFFVHKDAKLLRPKFHVVVPHYHPKSEDPKWIEWFRDMEAALPNDCSLFVGLSSKEMLQMNTGFGERAYFVDALYNPLTLSEAPIDLTKKIIVIRTVLAQCLAIAIFMGFDNVYLVGFDLDQMCSKDNAGRFYGLSKITDTVTERKIDENVKKSSEVWFHWWNTHLAFDLLRNSAISNGVHVYNATGAGLLETFDRVNYSDLFLKKG